jgi:hypothetical protein
VPVAANVSVSGATLPLRLAVPLPKNASSFAPVRYVDSTGPTTALPVNVARFSTLSVVAVAVNE